MVFSSTLLFVGVNGEPVDLAAAQRQIDSPELTIASTEVACATQQCSGVTVSTILFPCYPWGEPRPYQTAVMAAVPPTGSTHAFDLARYDTRAEAERGHKVIASLCRAHPHVRFAD